MIIYVPDSLTNKLILSSKVPKHYVRIALIEKMSREKLLSDDEVKGELKSVEG